MPDEMEDEVTLPRADAYDDVDLVEVRLQARQGSLPALLYRPGAEGPWPAVVLAAEAYGINTFTRRVAATLAHLGYVTLVPDYYRAEGPTDPEGYLDFTEVLEFIGDLDFRRATHDVVAAIDYLQDQPSVLADRVAVWGTAPGPRWPCWRPRSGPTWRPPCSSFRASPPLTHSTQSGPSIPLISCGMSGVRFSSSTETRTPSCRRISCPIWESGSTNGESPTRSRSIPGPGMPSAHPFPPPP